MKNELSKAFVSVLYISIFGLLMGCGGAKNDNKEAKKETYETLTYNLDTGLKRPNVVEFFYYRCPYCKKYSAPFSAWAKANPKVNIEIIPLAKGSYEASARAFYVAKKLKKMDEFHSQFFAAVASTKSLFYSKDEIKAYFKTNLNIDNSSFDNAWSSVEVDAAIVRAVNLAKRSGLRGVPFFVVNGKYHVFNQKDPNNTFKNIESLLNK